MEKFLIRSPMLPILFFFFTSIVNEGYRMVPAKSQSRKISVIFRGSQSLVFLQKAVSESRILKTKEISGKVSRARKNMPCLGVLQSLALTIPYPFNALMSGIFTCGVIYSNNIIYFVSVNNHQYNSFILMKAATSAVEKSISEYYM